MTDPRLAKSRSTAALFIQKVIAAALAFQIGMSGLLPAWARAALAPLPTQSQRGNSNVIALLLAASRAENPHRAIELLQAAREEVKKERLSDEDAARILGMIEDLEKKARARIERATPTPATGSNASSSSRDSLLQAKLPVVANLETVSGQSPKANAETTKDGLNVKDVEKTLASNPDVRDTMWEIGRSRLSRDARNLEAIVQERTGQTAAQIDNAEAQLRDEADKPGALLAFLNDIGLLKLDVSKSNLQLKQEYDGISLDILADQLISNAIKFSFGAGALRGALTEQGVLGNYGGLTIETAGTLAVNAKLVLRLADLYGVEMDETERQMVLSMVFLAFKVGIRYGVNSPNTQSLFATLGARIASLKSMKDAGGFIAFFKQFTQSKAIASAVTPEVSALLKKATDAADEATPKPAGTGAKPDAAPEGKPTTPHEKGRWKLKVLAEKLRTMQIIRILGQASLSGGETYGVGATAKYIFKGAHLEKRKVHNENFRRFLMTPTGEGFLKLLVLSMNDGRPSESEKGATEEMKAKTDFILNVARSARACSVEDQARASLDRSAAYACTPNANAARSERLKAEMLTYDEIPQDYIADLRVVSREQRLRMAELILQMQFLDGDRSPNETQFFRNVIVKTLGVDSVQDLEYFERLHAFVQESGGLERVANTPTGFAIRNTSKSTPYDMNRGYLPLHSPEPPPGPRYLPTSKAEAPKAQPAENASSR